MPSAARIVNPKNRIIVFDRRGIHETAVFPKGVQTAFQFKRGIFTDIALKNLIIISDHA